MAANPDKYSGQIGWPKWKHKLTSDWQWETRQQKIPVGYIAYLEGRMFVNEDGVTLCDRSSYTAKVNFKED